MKTFTFFNNKGGVGKTTLAVNIAAYLSIKFDKRVLFLDADPQANSTQMMIPEDQWETYYGDGADKTTLLDYLRPLEDGDASLNFSKGPISKEENRFNVDLIPGHPRLSIIEDILSDAWNKCISGDLGGFRRSNWLKAIITHYEEEYDYLIVDVGPSLGALNRSILLNTDYMITPMGSDIFSLIGVSNISNWMNTWMATYENAIGLLNKSQEKERIEKFQLNLDISNSPRLIGYSIQQYVTKSFKSGRRPIAAYDRIIAKTSETIMNRLNFLIFEGLQEEDLNLGDVPYLYSLVPLAQSNNAPMFDLKRADGLTGGQTSSVKKYEGMIDVISKKILSNIGEQYGN
ncbi:ParA family protein [Bacillus sp. RIT694]|uniref:ParA family protein n=1 Tax=Bacillus sp. RIT694 TaxID=2666190 RepID=UPI0012ACAAFC|nr:ParA family protein [Bacillus sp. RIT694]MRS25597.1 AAA family ATPase [Bacillus sp. RIT694]